MIKHIQMMFVRVAVRFLFLVLSYELALPLYAAQPAALPGASEPTTNGFHPITPGPADGRIAYVTARLLEQLQYSKEKFTASVSSKFLDRYLDALDPQHLHFLQADLSQFEEYRTNLDRLTEGKLGVADTEPACEIFNRFVERLEQRVAYADELLNRENFTFEGDERISVNRHEAPYPTDLTEARNLWRERLRSEYLQEKLSKLDAKKKAGAATRAKNLEKERSPAAPEENTEAKPKKTDAEEIVETLSHRYHRVLRMYTDWNNDDVLQVYLTALAHVYDPHSDYLGHAQLDQFAIGMNLSLFGIGAELRSEDGYCTIQRLLPGGPAIKSQKIKEKDRIVAVAQSNQPPVDVVDMNLSKAVQLIRGTKGTEVRLTLIPAGADSSVRKEVSLIRDEIPLEDQAAKARIIEWPAGQGANLRIGVISLPSFYAPFDPSNSRDKNGPKSTTSEDVAKLLTKLKQENVSGIILDLRLNGGGSLEEAIKLTGLFIKEGPVVQVRNSDGTVDHDDDTDPAVLYEGPLVVLTSRLSASASEILAGALQDYGRALVVGESSTHGKGTVQSVQPLKPWMKFGRTVLTNDPGALKVTVKKFYRASGASTQLKGVVPDIVLPSVFNESKEIGEAALENPLPWDTIPSAKYEQLNLVAPYLAELRKRSVERIATNQDFAYIGEDIALFKKHQADKTISLDERQRLQEKAEAEARQKARDQERLARAEPQEKIYELALKQVNLPGLPPPIQNTNSLARLSGRKGMPLPAVATNVTAAAARDQAGDAGLDEDAEEAKPPAVDAALAEAEHILVDYLAVFPKPGVLTAGH